MSDIIKNAENLASFSEEINNMRRLRNEILQTSAEHPTAYISIASADCEYIRIAWDLGLNGEARSFYDDPIRPLTGLTGHILQELDKRISESEKELANLIEEYKKNLDEVAACQT